MFFIGGSEKSLGYKCFFFMILLKKICFLHRLMVCDCGSCYIRIHLIPHLYFIDLRNEVSGVFLFLKLKILNKSIVGIFSPDFLQISKSIVPVFPKKGMREDYVVFLK